MAFFSRKMWTETVATGRYAILNFNEARVSVASGGSSALHSRHIATTVSLGTKSDISVTRFSANLLASTEENHN